MNFFKSIVCASVTLAIVACSDNESAQSYITKAESLIVKEQPNAAIISLKNALKLESKNAQARFLLGQLYLNSGDADNAAKELEHANKLKYEVNKVLPLLARAYMLSESDLDLLALSTQEKQLTTPNTQYLAYKTVASLRSGDEQLAQESVSAALAVSETDSYSMLANAYFVFSQEDIARAGTLVERILTATPNNADALMLQGQIATVEKNYVLAVDSFKQYLSLQPSSGKVQLFIADGLIKNGQFDEAEKMADAILAKVPSQPFMLYIKAMARFENKDYQAANSLAGQSLSSGFNSFSLKLVAGASAFYLQNYEQSNLYLTDIVSYLPVEHPARKMLAVSQLKLGLIDDLGETLSSYDATNQENAQFLTTLSYELLEVGALEKAQQMASDAASTTDMTAEQTARAGVLKLMMNDPTGIENLELALLQNPELISAELALAFASIKSGDLERADQIADKWLEQYPENAGGYNLKATIYFKNKELVKGKAALEKSLQVEPNNVYALTEMVRLANYQNDSEQAILLTEQALQAHPNNVEVLYQYFEYHKDDAGLQVITKAYQENSSDIKYGMVLAQALIQMEQYKQASAILADYKVDVKTPKRYWQLVLIANEKQPDGKDIYSILDSWNKTNPYHLEPVLLLVNYWNNKNSSDRSLNVLQKSLNKHPNNVMLHLVKMQVLLNAQQSDDAKLWLKELEKFEINENLLAGIEGRILLLDKEYAAAIPKLTLQYEMSPTVGNATSLALALTGNNQKAEAISLLEQFSDNSAAENKINPTISLNLANMYLAEHQDKAIAEYERLIKVAPDNVVALNNLSWLYMDKGKLTQALTYSELAYEKAPRIPNVVDTYAQVLLKSNKQAEALDKAEEAYRLSSGKDVDIALNYAQVLFMNKKNSEAKLVLKAVNPITAQQKEKKQQLSK